MKTKKIIKMTYILILFALIIPLLFPISNVQATTCPVCKGTGYQPGSNFTLCPKCSGTGTTSGSVDPNYYKPGSLTQEDYEKPFKLAGVIVNAITVTGIVVAVVTTMILGIKYMIGSVEERAEYKKTMMPIMVGMIMLFCTTTIVSIIWNIVSNIE